MVNLALGSSKDSDTGKMVPSMEIPLSINSLGVQSGAKLAFPVTFSTPGRVKAILFLRQSNNTYTQHIPGCQILSMRIFPLMIDDVMVAVRGKKREKCPWQSVWKGRWGPETIHLQSYGKLGTESRVYGPSYRWGVTLPILINLRARPCVLLAFLCAALSGRLYLGS